MKVVVVPFKCLPSWKAYCENNDLKYESAGKDEKGIHYSFKSEEEASKAAAWVQRLLKFETLEGNIDSNER